MPSCPVCLWHSPSPSFGLSAPILQDRQPTTPNACGDKLDQLSKQLSTHQTPILHCSVSLILINANQAKSHNHLYFALMKHLFQDKRDTYDKYIELQNYPKLNLGFLSTIASPIFYQSNNYQPIRLPQAICPLSLSFWCLPMPTPATRSPLSTHLPHVRFLPMQH